MGLSPLSWLRCGAGFCADAALFALHAPAAQKPIGWVGLFFLFRCIGLEGPVYGFG